jgi:hypothetical protein
MTMTENATDTNSEAKTENQKTEKSGNQNAGSQRFNDVIPEPQPQSQPERDLR